MLEYWFKERRTMVDFRRGPLEPYFDGLAARLKERGYSHTYGRHLLAKCCLFNSYLVDQGITRSREIKAAHFQTFMDAYFADFRSTGCYRARNEVWVMLRPLFFYLIDEGVLKPVKPKPLPAAYRWVLDPYLRYLREDLKRTEGTIRNASNLLCRFLDGLGEGATRTQMRALRAPSIEAYIKQYLKDSPDNLRRMVGTLRGFLRFCARQGYIISDLSVLIPSVPSYRLASLPKGMEDTALERILNVIRKGTAVGARDYAIMLLMMAYGIRGKSAAELLLEDIDWRRSTIRIRAQKGGKEVVLPLVDAVGEAIISYLHHRPESRLREVFLSVKAPFLALNGRDISHLVRVYMTKAGVKTPKSGSTTLRHSWAIRALAHDSPMKAIADVLGHRCLNTTFIYAKADLKALRQVAMSWPEGR
ncbi:MAG: Tyrosine recombinase XerD [Syntrophorhabdaceae bacterium PtaU1.Bin034]|nr:MAG: Tyrosine recombinase XerD [Syntrophorhabdaceae bacterium PtaU1.Bin034]